MDADRFLRSAEEFAIPFSGPALPFALIDLDSTAASARIHPPPYPLIGLGSRLHPAANMVDAVAEHPVSLRSIANGIMAAPQAAAICVQLTRATGELSEANALLAESLAFATLQGGGEHRTWLDRPRPASASEPGAVRVRRLGDVLAITLDRPSAHNAIDAAMRDQLRDAFLIALLDPDVRLVHLSGAGRAFSLGGDLSEFGTTHDPALAHSIRMQTLPAPVVAGCAARLDVHVHGPCVGAGLELAAFGRTVTASRSSWFQLPELAMGLIPGAGGTFSLSRRIGRQRTNLMILSGRRISAETALDWGLVDRLVDD